MSFRKKYLNEMSALRYANGNFVKINGYKIYIREDDHNPPHIHAQKGENDISININGFKSTYSHNKELDRDKKEIIDWMQRNQSELMECWNETKINPHTDAIFTRDLREKLSIEDDIDEEVAITKVRRINDVEIYVDFICGIKMKCSLAMLDRKVFYMSYDSSGISYINSKGEERDISAYWFWNNGEIV